jgi:Flp pilus assembly protein TadD
LKKYDLAVDYFEKSHDLHFVKEAGYLNATGVAYAKMGDFKIARKRFERLQIIQPNNVQTYRNWGLFYALTKQENEAFDNLEKAIQLGYDNWEWIKTEEALEPLRTHPRYQALLEKAPADE